MSTEQKNIKKKKFDVGLLRRLFSFTGPYKKTLYFAITMSVILAALSPVRPYLIQYSVDAFISKKAMAGISVYQHCTVRYCYH